MSASSCPRCASVLEQFSPPVSATLGAVLLDRCTRCGGVWLDGPEVTAVAPMLGTLENHRDWLMAQRAVPPAGITRCPACQDETVECPAYGVRLDVCLGCLGVWLDGGELETMQQNTALAQGAGQGTARAGMVACTACRAFVLRATTWETSQGPVCNTCYNNAEAPTALEPPRRLEVSDALDAAEGAFVAVEVVGGIAELLGAIFKVLE